MWSVLLIAGLLTLRASGTRLCRPGQLPAYIRTDGYGLSGIILEKIKSVTESECKTACSDVLKWYKNDKFIHAFGSEFTLAAQSQERHKNAACFAADYTKSGGTCTLFREEIGVNRNPNAVALQKRCYTDSMVQRCSDDITHLPNVGMLGRARAVSTERSMSSCIATCMISKGVFEDFQCRSVQYFPTEKSMNCVLNDMTLSEGRRYLTTLEGSNFYDFKCQDGLGSPRIIPPLFALDNPEWSEWTPCHQQTQVRQRFRRCEANLPSSCDVETGPCFELRNLMVKLGPNSKNADLFQQSDRRGNKLNTICSPFLDISGKPDCDFGGFMFVEGVRIPCVPRACQNF